MSKVMLVNVTHVEESRVAVLDEGVLAEYEIETINRTSLKGNIHNAVVESVHPSLEAAFVRIGPDLKGFLPLDEVNFNLLPTRSDSRKQGKIGQHLHQGQKLMVQVVREPFAGKPPTVSTYFSFPGRYLVLMPGVESSGISRKIEDVKHRERLKKILGDLRAPEGFGLIVRTAGIGQTKSEIQRDMRYLLRLWEAVQRSSKNTDFPGLVYREADLVIRTIRDHLTPDIGEVWIDSKETYDRALTFVKNVMPTRSRTLKLFTGDRPLFNKFNLEEQIERIYKRRVPLPSGGEIVIDGTEALTAIDVNSARSRKSGDVEENAFQTNLEAAVEIARQLRLRDLGGLVVIDFIDMLATRNKKKVEKAIKDAMRGDRAKHDITVISKLGLMEIARQRIKGAKMAASYATCTACDGHGLIKNIETAALSALRKLQTRCARGGFGTLRMDLTPEVATWVSNTKREEILRIERRYDIRIEVRPVESLMRHESRFEVFAREKPEAAASPVPAAEAERGADSVAAAPAERIDAPVTKSRAETAAPVEEQRKAATKAEEKKSADAEAEKTDAKSSGEATERKRSGEAAESKSSGEAAESKSKRRRKRRRRPRSQSGEGAEASPPADGDGRGNGGAPPEPKERQQPPVPRNIRADELMPAATGNAAEKGGNSKSKSGPARRKKKTGSRGSRSRRSSRGGRRGSAQG